MKSKHSTFFLSKVKHLQCLGYDPKLFDISRIRKMWSTLKWKENQLRPTFIWSRYRNWQDFKAAIIIPSEVRENMNEKMGNLSREIGNITKKPNGNFRSEIKIYWICLIAEERWQKIYWKETNRNYLIQREKTGGKKWMQFLQPLG